MHKSTFPILLLTTLFLAPFGARATNDSIPETNTSPSAKTQFEPNKNTFGFWAGVTLAGALSSDTEGEKSPWFQIGGQIIPKNSPYQSGIMIRPLLYRKQYFNDFKKQGISGELIFFLKKVSIGRLSGNVSNAYWGLDLQVGQRAYSYQDEYNLKPETVKVHNTWFAVLPRVGYQFFWGPLALDLSIPIGFRRTHFRIERTNSSNHTIGTIIFQPSCALGYFF